MAPALASAAAGTDSIKGLAQSIAKPAYRRLLVAEPALRRAVPVLIIAFLGTMAGRARGAVDDSLPPARAPTRTPIVTDIASIADLVGARLDQAIGSTRADPRHAQELLDRALGARATEGGRPSLVRDPGGAGGAG